MLTTTSQPRKSSKKHSSQAYGFDVASGDDAVVDQLPAAFMVGDLSIDPKLTQRVFLI
jgi:hypothetical protein